MVKILVMATLLLGSLVLLTNVMPTSRQDFRSRRMFGIVRGPAPLVAAIVGHKDPDDSHRETARDEKGKVKVRKTEEEWKAELTDEQYQVTRCSATEQPFTGQYWNHHEDGTYTCVGCGQELFTSDAKFDSGSGWPSYTGPVGDEAVAEIKDISYGTVRTEIVCSRCEAHLGHVFPDGPLPAGLRYCINSASLDFVEKGGQTPTARP